MIICSCVKTFTKTKKTFMMNAILTTINFIEMDSNKLT